MTIKQCYRRPFISLFLVVSGVTIAAQGIVAFPHNQFCRRGGCWPSSTLSDPRKCTLLHSSSTYDFNDDLIADASQQLSWEKVAAAKNKPVLNLSAREDSPEKYTDESGANTSGWDQGQQWTTTRRKLEELGLVALDDAKILQACPQLLRLDSAMIQETAKWVLEEFDTEYLESEWKLLSYPVEDASYGLEFLATMMMMTSSPGAVRSLCKQSTDMLIQGIEGGIQERAVQSALGAASDATSQASKTIASDTMDSLRQLRLSRRNKI